MTFSYSSPYIYMRIIKYMYVSRIVFSLSLGNHPPPPFFTLKASDLDPLLIHVCEWGDEDRTEYEKIFPHVLVTKTNYAECGVEDSVWVFEEKVKTGESRVAKGEIRQIAVKDIPDLITRILQGKNTSDYMQLPLENFNDFGDGGWHGNTYRGEASCSPPTQITFPFAMSVLTEKQSFYDPHSPHTTPLPY